MHTGGMITSEHLKSVRERLRETQARFGERFGVDQATIHRWETKGPPAHGTAPLAIERVLQELDA